MVKFKAPKKSARSKPVKKKILVTSALPYANGPIHIGHLVEYIQTDIFVRFLKLTKSDVIYICADDAHGAPIEIKASQMGISPEQLIGQFYKEHTQDFKKFHIEFDNYYTTNSPENKQYSDLIFTRLKEKGHIYTKDIEVTYCQHCKRTLPDRYVKGKCPKCNAPEQYGDVCEQCNFAYKTIDLVEPYCTICKKRPVRKTSKHYFFKLREYAPALQKWLTENKNLQPEIKNFVMQWVTEGLSDWDISRDGPYFGFKIPGEEDKYYYVWLDAPIGYIAATDNYCTKNNLSTSDYWQNSKTKIIHFIGKDITYFHFLFWPAMLIGAGFNLPHDIVVHGFLTVQGEKMSKSRGTFLTAKDFAEQYPPEYLRFYYAHSLSKKLSDIDLDFAHFVSRINNELVANIGNFCYRVISFANKNFGGKINGIDSAPEIILPMTNMIKEIEGQYTSLNFNEALKTILTLSSLGNKYFQDNEPWKRIAADRQKTHLVLGLCVAIAKNLSILISPILPEFSRELQKQLGVDNLSWADLNFSMKEYTLGAEKMLVTKIEQKILSPPVTQTTKLFPLNLKIGQVQEVMDHPDADKLYIVKINLGSEIRQLVAGLKGHLSKEELLGKKIVVITNLKPAKIRGVASQGMMLAGDDGAVVRPLEVTKSNPGDRVYFEGLENGTAEVTFEEFGKLSMAVTGGCVYYDGKLLKTDLEIVQAPSVKDGARVR